MNLSIIIYTIVYTMSEIRLLKSSNLQLIRENTHISETLREQLTEKYVNGLRLPKSRILNALLQSNRSFDFKSIATPKKIVGKKNPFNDTTYVGETTKKLDRTMKHVFNNPENEIFAEEETRSNLRSYLQESHFKYDFVPNNFISVEVLESGANHLKFNIRELKARLAKIKQDFGSDKNAMGYVETTYRIFRLDEDGNEDIRMAYHSSRNAEFSTYQDIDAMLQELVNSFNEAIKKTLTSDWSLKDVTNMTIYYTSVTPRLGGNYIETPKCGK
jgi:hypothetical protein